MDNSYLKLADVAAFMWCDQKGLEPLHPKAQAIAGVQVDLTKIGVVSVSGAQSWTADQATRFDANVMALQCTQHLSDPVVAMIAGPVTMDLSGTFSQPARSLDHNSRKWMPASNPGTVQPSDNVQLPFWDISCSFSGYDKT
ncbi:hypothetical protein [Gluconobacter sphaericus]|uniref:hypothetical protein n=1 Tax=Gluconobacter sphaericus TaxID=574987 RepID=UPI00312B5B5D